MKLIANLILASLLAFFLAGCGHTVIGGAGVASPDKKYKIYIESHGKSAHAYTEYTVKKVGMSIVDTLASADSNVFSKWAILHASDLSWRCTWLDAFSVRIDFFERKGKSEAEANCGFLLIKQESNTKLFLVTEHSKNIEIKAHSYFF